jgi:rhamnosyltransferase subunit B
MASRSIVVATIGSLGDLHPCLALALELRRRGHRLTIASSHFHRARVEELGINFHAIRPNWEPNYSELFQRCTDIRKSAEVLVRQIILPELRGTYDDLLSVAFDADLMIGGEVVYPAPLVAETLGLRWVSAILSPSSFLSAYDPSVLINAPELIRLRGAGWVVNRALLNLGRMATRKWWNPVRRLRQELGLRPDCDPLFRDKFSPDLVLALFSRWLAQPQPDWPVQTLQAGYVYYGHDTPNANASADLTSFLASGEAPIVFTLGSAAVHIQGNFSEISIAAAQQLKRRAVLLLGSDAVPTVSSPNVLAIPYAPYSQVFPRAAAIVNQGGAGTIAQALRAGRPMLVVPFGWDQADNAARIERMGAGLHLPRKKYSPNNAAVALRQLLEDKSFATCAAEIEAQLQEEDGLNSACNAIESLL